MDRQMQHLQRPAVSFFWNYNTVEAVLLFCAVIVNLAGVMFESGQLNQPGYAAEKAFVTWVVVLVIVISVVYFFIVLFSEIYLMCTVNSKKNIEKGIELAKLEAAARRRANSAALSTVSASDGDTGEGVDLNPLFTKSVVTDDGATQGITLQALLQLPVLSPNQWAAVASSAREVMAQYEAAAKELAACRRALETQGATTVAGRPMSAGARATGAGGAGLVPKRAPLARRGSTVGIKKERPRFSSVDMSDDGEKYSFSNPLFHA